MRLESANLDRSLYRRISFTLSLLLFPFKIIYINYSPEVSRAGTNCLLFLKRRIVGEGENVNPRSRGRQEARRSVGSHKSQSQRPGFSRSSIIYLYFLIIIQFSSILGFSSVFVCCFSDFSSEYDVLRWI